MMEEARRATLVVFAELLEHRLLVALALVLAALALFASASAGGGGGAFVLLQRLEPLAQIRCLPLRLFRLLLELLGFVKN